MKRFAHGQYKPPLGYGLNPAHPLAPCVADAWFLQEGGGTTLTSLLYGTAIPTIGSPTWDGRGFVTNATGAGSSLTTPGYLKINPPFSLAWQGRMLSTDPNPSADLFTISYNNVNGSPFDANVVYWDHATGKFTYATNDGTTFRSVADSSGLAVTGRQQIVGTTGSANGNFIKIFRNGVQGATSAVGISTTAYAATSQTGFGAITGNSSFNSQAIHDFAILFRRELRQHEIQLLWLDPYDLLEPIRPRSRSVASIYLSKLVGQRARLAGMSGGLAG